MWRTFLTWSGSLWERPILVETGVNTDGGPLVAVVRPRGVGRGALMPRGQGLLPGQGRGAAIRRILASMAHDREGYVGGLADWD